MLDGLHNLTHYLSPLQVPSARPCLTIMQVSFSLKSLSFSSHCILLMVSWIFSTNIRHTSSSLNFLSWNIRLFLCFHTFHITIPGNIIHRFLRIQILKSLRFQSWRNWPGWPLIRSLLLKIMAPLSHKDVV